MVINGDPEVINGARGGLVNHMRSLLFQKLLISLINVINVVNAFISALAQTELHYFVSMHQEVCQSVWMVIPDHLPHMGARSISHVTAIHTSTANLHRHRQIVEAPQLYSTLQHPTALYSPLQHSIALYSTL